MRKEAGNAPAMASYVAVGYTLLNVWWNDAPVPEEEGVVMAILSLVQHCHGNRPIKGPCELVIVLPPHEAEVDGEV